MMDAFRKLVNEFFSTDDMKHQSTIVEKMKENPLPGVLAPDTFKYLIRYSLKYVLDEDIQSLSEYFKSSRVKALGDVHDFILLAIDRYERFLEQQEELAVESAKLKSIVDQAKSNPELRAVLVELTSKWEWS